MAPRDEHNNSALTLNRWEPEAFHTFVERLQWAWYENERDDELDASLHALASESFSAFSKLIREAWSRHPVCTAALLGAMRRYRTLYPPTSDESDLSTKESRVKVQRDDALLQHIISLIVMLYEETNPQASELGSLILNYELAMAEKLDGSTHRALILIEHLIDHIKNTKISQPAGTNIFHTLFTFDELSIYAEFQRSLIRSRLGQNAFSEKEGLEDIAKDLIGLHSSLSWNTGERNLVAASQVRYFFHMESLLRRDHGDDYLKRLNQTNPNLSNDIILLMKSLIHQNTNKQLVKLQTPRILSLVKGEEEWYTTGWMKNRYQQSINDASSILKFYVSPQRKDDMKSVAEVLFGVGDLSRQNPYNQNPTDLTNLTMFQPNLIPKLILGKDRPEDKNRLAYSMMAMTDRRPGGINFANTLVDAAFFHSLRVEKIQTIHGGLANHESLEEILRWGLRKGTGHLVDLSSEVRCEYAKENHNDINKLSKQDQRNLDFMNHFLNSYFPMPLFSVDKKKKRGFTKTMHINRLNAIGKGITSLVSSFGLSSSRTKKMETAAEKYGLNILPTTWTEKDCLLHTMMLQSLFVLSRLEELLTQLTETKSIFLRTSMPRAFRKRIEPLIEKFAFYLSLEVYAVQFVTETLENKIDIDVVLQWLDDYEREIVEYGDIGGGKKSRHPIFQNLVDEKTNIVGIIRHTNGIHGKLEELSYLCHNLCQRSTIPFRLGQAATLSEFYLTRQQFGKEICEGKFSGDKILTSNLLSARLIQQFVDMMSQN